MKKPKYSFIVPVYNTEKHVSNCIESILRQRVKDFELILVNDGSTDKSYEICKQYKEKNDSIIKLINLKNSGVSVARNTGIDAAEGEYIIFVDSDDYISDEMIEELELFDDDMIMFDYYEIDKNDNKCIYRKSSSKEKETIKISSPWFFACKKNVYLKNSIKFPIGLLHEDDAVSFKVFFHASTISYLEKPLYYYQVNRENSTMTLKSQKMIDDLFTVTTNNINYFMNKMSQKELETFINKSCVGKYFDYLLFDTLKNKDQDRILKQKKEIIKVLDNTGVKWKKSEYFYANSLALSIFRRCIKYDVFIKICSFKWFKKILNRKVNGNA